jgi:hypothetical protein
MCYGVEVPPWLLGYQRLIHDLCIPLSRYGSKSEVNFSMN